MLAGYLPFDDDPANPEGDNINLLYKYIVSTPLTFPEYVTPHARDLLRRILVPDPRKRADLFEVARHSWLSEYSHVVGFITSSTTTSKDIGQATVNDDDHEVSTLARSASVREPSKATKPPKEVGGLSTKHGNVDQEAAEAYPKVTTKDNKRRTVQVEYVAPRSQTQRGEPSTVTASAPSGSRTRARAGSQGPIEVPQASRRVVSTEKPLPQDPPVTRNVQYPPQTRRPSSSRQDGMPPPSRPLREPPRSASEANYLSAHAPPVSIARPNTGGSMTSTASRSGSLPLASRASYSTPAAPTVAGTNAQGRMAQPNHGKGSYHISGPMEQDSSFGQPSTQMPTKISKATTSVTEPDQKGHKRSNTIGGIFSRTNSIFGGKRHHENVMEKSKKSYPPVSMSGAVTRGEDTPRQSMESSRRSISFGFGRKRSGSVTGSQTTLQEKPRRFSLLPQSFSLKAIGIGKDSPGPHVDRHYDDQMDGNGQGQYLDPPQTGGVHDSGRGGQLYTDGSYERSRDSPVRQARRGTASTSSPVQHQRYASSQPQQISDPRSGVPPQFLPPLNFRNESAINTESESSLNDPRHQKTYQENTYTGYDDAMPDNRRQTKGRGVLQKNNRKFTDAYEGGGTAGDGWGGQPGGHSDHAGSSGAAKKVMDFFRRRGRERGQ